MSSFAESPEAGVEEASSPVAEPILRQGTITVLASALSLVSNLGTGVLLARHLGTSGRGATTAIQTSTQLCGWLFLLGSAQTISYYQARNPDRGATLFGTWLAILVPLSLIAVGVGQLLIPIVMAAQTAHTIVLARVFMTTVGLVLLTEFIAGYILGNKRFFLFNALRVGTPATVAICYVGLWAVHGLTVTSAVWSFAIIQAVSMAGTVVVCARWHGIARPDIRLARETLWYGLRAHGTNVSTLLNARLDLMLMPAFLSASSVGLYSVATNVSWVIVILAGSLSMIVLPLAARAGRGGAKTIIRSLHGTAAVAFGLGVTIWLLAPTAVHVVYGRAFDPCVQSLRLLLPGSVFYAMAMVLIAGLYAVHRPFIAAFTQAVGLIFTLTGLLLFLRQGGLEAAAIVSSVAYTVVFVIALICYRSVVRLRWSDFLPTSMHARNGGRGGAI